MQYAEMPSAALTAYLYSVKIKTKLYNRVNKYVLYVGGRRYHVPDHDSAE